MKKFKNNFGVKGSLPLLKALKEEVEKLGWKYDNDFNSGHSKSNPDLYFNARRPKDAMKINHFSFSNASNCTIYTLPQQWDECLKAASELEEEIPEYIEFIDDTFTCFTEGVIYPLNEEGRCQCNTGEYLSAMQYPKDKKWMKPSTKSAYEKQQKEFKIQKLLEEAARRYPVGTKFRCLVTNNIETIPKNTTFKIDWGGIGNQIYSYVNERLFHKHYYNGKWAEIIEPKKEVEPWAIGTYVVFLKEYGKSSVGDIDKIENVRDDKQVATLEKEDISPGPKDSDEYLKWFPTLQEAEAFSKELLKVEPMEIAGYSVKFKDNKVSIGCYKDITLKDLKTMRKAIKVASKFGKDLTVTEDSIIDDTEGSAIFLDEIEQLIERLDG